MTRRRDDRSTTAPATNPNSTTGTISKATTPATRTPEPVSWYTRITRATELKVSPHREIVWAANRLRKPRRCRARRSGLWVAAVAVIGERVAPLNMLR
jgi:hypothetical protein